MEAKSWQDTVMANAEILEVFRKTPHLSDDAQMAMLGGKAVAKAQAKLSFKARQDEIDLLQSIINSKDVAITDLKSLLELAKDYAKRQEQEGRRQVVEWVEKHLLPYDFGSVFSMAPVSFGEWEAQLKVWFPEQLKEVGIDK